MKKYAKIASSALTLALLTGSAAFADSTLDQLFKSVKSTVSERVTEQVNKLTGKQPASDKIYDTVADHQFSGRFVTASGGGMDVFIDFAPNGLYRRKDIYAKQPDDSFLDMGTWQVGTDGTITLKNTYGESQAFTLTDKNVLVLKGSDGTLENILKKDNFDLFDDRHFLVDLGKTLTVHNEQTVITLSGDGTYRYAKLSCNKPEILMQGLWAETGSDGLIQLLGGKDVLRLVPMKKGFAFADDRGNPVKDSFMKPITRVNLFQTDVEMTGTLERDPKGHMTFLTQDGMRYDVNSEKSNLKGLVVGKPQKILMKVSKPADDDRHAEAVISPLQ